MYILLAVFNWFRCRSYRQRNLVYIWNKNCTKLQLGGPSAVSLNYGYANNLNKTSNNGK